MNNAKRTIHIFTILIRYRDGQPNKLTPNYRNISMIKSELPNKFKPSCRKYYSKSPNIRFFDYLCKIKYFNLRMVIDIE